MKIDFNYYKRNIKSKFYTYYIKVKEIKKNKYFPLNYMEIFVIITLAFSNTHIIDFYIGAYWWYKKLR